MTKERPMAWPHAGWLHRCYCCHARNRSVAFWAEKGRWLCGECGFGLCNFDCGGIPWRRQHPKG